MAIAATDIKRKLSVVAAAGNTTGGTPSTSLGDQISTTEWVDGGTLFDTITGAENAAATVDYRCVFIHNAHATLTLTSAVVYVSSQVAGGADIAIAVDNIAASAIGSASAQAAVIATETTAPAGVGAFSAPSTAGTGLALGDLLPGYCRAVWIRRTATNSGPIDTDGFTLAVTGDTAA